jgi:predicted nucleic acid-binding protein
MSGLVLDASVVIAEVLQEHNAVLAHPLLERVGEQGAIVPGHWHLEIANTLLVTTRRRGLAPDRRGAILRNLRGLPISTDPETPHRAWEGGMALAERHGLTLYDAAYLELTLRLGLPLASFDGALRRAATAENVPLL